MKKEIDAEVVKSTINLGKLIFQFARVNRITYFEDGETLESDTDHTVMLSVIACAFASTYKKELDLGLVAQFAIVHDLVEAYAGDTPNIHGQMKEGLKEDKIKREHEALLRIQKEFDEVYPWISKMIIEYESLATPEARFVKVLDKAMPKISHILNGVKRLKEYNYDKETTRVSLNTQVEKIEAEYGSDQEEVIVLLRHLANEVVASF